MTDPLEEAREEGRAAAVRIIEDLVRTRDLDECAKQIQTAATNDTAFNFNLLKGIASFAALGWELSSDQSKPNE